MKLKAKQEEEHAAVSNGSDRGHDNHENAQSQYDTDETSGKGIDDEQAEADIWAPRSRQDPEVSSPLYHQSLSCPFG